MQLMHDGDAATGSPVMRLLSATLFLGSVASVLIVGERAIAAIWQWYKYFGYPTPGIITMSLNMGLVFTAAAATLCSVSLVVLRANRRKSESIGFFLSKYSALLYIASIAIYWLIAASPLNQWRV